MTRESMIYLRITVNGNAVENQHQKKMRNFFLERLFRKANGKTEFAKALNAYPEILQRKLYEKRKEQIERDLSITLRSADHMAD